MLLILMLRGRAVRKPAARDRHRFDKRPLSFGAPFRLAFFHRLNTRTHRYVCVSLYLSPSFCSPFLFPPLPPDRSLMTTRRGAIDAIGAIMILFIDCNLLGAASPSLAYSPARVRASIEMIGQSVAVVKAGTRLYCGTADAQWRWI